MITNKQISGNLNPLTWILLLVRGCCCLLPVCWLYVYHQFLSRLIFIDIIRRYLTCVSNLVCIRVVLLALGFLRFENESFNFFNREQYSQVYEVLTNLPQGIANHYSIVDFLFYNYILSPVFVRILIVNHENGTTEFMYLPLTFVQAAKCAMTARGFEPIVITEKEINKIKLRKLTMPLLVVETFEGMLGPILIMLPGIFPQEYLSVDSRLISVLESNQAKFSRWTIIGMNNIYMNQIDLVLDLLESVKTRILKVDTKQFHRHINYQHNLQTAIRTFYLTEGVTQKSISYTDYIQQLDNKQAEQVLVDPKQAGQVKVE